MKIGHALTICNPCRTLFLSPLRIPDAAPVGLASDTTLLVGAAQTFHAENKCSLVADTYLDPDESDFSVEFWFKPSALADYAGVLRTGARANADPGFYVCAMANGSLRVSINDSVQPTRTVGDVTGAAALVVGTWTHCLVVFDRDENATAYLDGVASGVTLDISSHQSQLGAIVKTTLGALSGYYLSGTVCCVRYWPTLLTASDAQYLCNQKQPRPYGQLSAEYRALLGATGRNWNLDEASVGDPAYVTGASLTVRDQHGSDHLTFTPANILFSNYDFENSGSSSATITGSYVTQRARSGNVATLTTSTPHGLVNGSVVTIASMSVAAYDASSVTVTRVSDTVFTYANTGSDEGATAESAGRVTATVFAGYGAVTTNGTVERASDSVHGGSYSCKLTRLAASGNSPNLYHGSPQRPIVVPGHTYRHSVWCRGDGTHQPYLAFYDVTNSAYIGSTSRPTGISGTSWANSNITFAAPAGCVSIYVVYRGGASADAIGAYTYFDDSALYATHLTAANGPYGAIASDRVGDNHLTLQGRDRVAEVTDWRTSGPHGSFTTAVKNSGSLGAGFNGAMRGFADVDAGRPADVPAGRSGRSIRFDGVNDFVSAPDPGESLTTLTVCCWIKATESASATGVFLSHNNGSTNFRWSLSQLATTNVLRFYISKDGGNVNIKDYRDSVAINDNTWHHVAMVFDGTQADDANRLAVYKDGVQLVPTKEKDVALTSMTAFDIPISIGSSMASNAPASFFKGQVYDARIYNTVLSAADILAVKNNTYSATQPIWSGIDESDTPRSVLNLSGAGSLNHDGSDDYEIAASAADLNFGTGSFTLSAWVKCGPDTGGAEAAIAKIPSSTSTGDGYLLAVNKNANDGFVSVRVCDGTTTLATDADGRAVDDAAWHHLCAVVDRTAKTVTRYVDATVSGAVLDISTITGSIDPAENLMIGARPATAATDLFFTGLIADPRIYKGTALSAEQVAELYAGAEVTGATPVARWDFGDGAQGSPSQYDPIVSWVTGDDARSQLFQTTFTAQPFADCTKLGGSLGAYFDGIDDYLSTTTIPFAFGQEGSIWGMIATDGTLATDQTILSFNDTASASRYLRVFIPANTRHLAIGVRNDDTEDILETDLSVRDTGSTFAVICDGTTTAIYVDGNRAVLTQTSGTGQSRWLDDVTGEDNLVLGAQVTSAGVSKFLKGHIYAWAVTPKVLILSEVWGLANWARQFGVTKQ